MSCHVIGVGGTEYRGVAGTEYRYSLRFQPKLMDESFKGLTGADGARDRKPEPGVSSDMHTEWPASICGSSNFNKPSSPSSSSLDNVAKLLKKLLSTCVDKKRTSQGPNNKNIHALQSRQHEEAITERVVLCYLVQSMARIVRFDSTGKDWVIRHRPAEHTA